jgi:sulfur carrier protein ThiS
MLIDVYTSRVPGTTTSDVMAKLGFPAERPYLVILNGTALPKAERETRRSPRTTSLPSCRR